MPRRARMKLAGYPQHIVQRGHNRACCFPQPVDYQLYLGLLDELRKPYECHVHAYVLMPNHVHLLLTSDRDMGPSDMLRRLNIRYVLALNRRYRRTGSAWEGRFWSSLVGGRDYLLRCHRYIDLNPVRAAIAAHPAAYPWSSYACNALGTPDPIVEPHAEYLALGRDDGARRAAYGSLVEERLSDAQLEEIRAATRRNLPYASDEFISALELAYGRRFRARNRRAVADTCVPKSPVF